MIDVYQKLCELVKSVFSSFYSDFYYTENIEEIIFCKRLMDFFAIIIAKPESVPAILPLRFYLDREKTEIFHVELLINEFSKFNWNVKRGFSYIEFINFMGHSKKAFYLNTIESRDLKNILWKVLCSIYESFGAVEFSFSYWILESPIIYEQYIKLNRKEKKKLITI